MLTKNITLPNFKDNTKGGKCSGCTACCSNLLPLGDDEITRVKKYLKKNDIEVHNPNNIFSKYIDKCPFLVGNRCSIYDQRFEICKYFSCNPDLKEGEFNHKGKHVRNVILTFNENAYMPEDAPDIEKLDKNYQEKKKKAGVK